MIKLFIKFIKYLYNFLFLYNYMNLIIDSSDTKFGLFSKAGRLITQKYAVFKRKH